MISVAVKSIVCGAAGVAGIAIMFQPLNVGIMGFRYR
jgi:Na+/serine symporter